MDQDPFALIPLDTFQHILFELLTSCLDSSDIRPLFRFELSSKYIHSKIVSSDLIFETVFRKKFSGFQNNEFALLKQVDLGDSWRNHFYKMLRLQNNHLQDIICFQKLPVHRNFAVGLCSDGKWLFSAGWELSIQVFSIQSDTGKLIHCPKATVINEEIPFYLTMAFFDSTEWLISGGNTKIYLYHIDPVDDYQPLKFQYSFGQVQGEAIVKFHRDILVSGDSKSVQIWDCHPPAEDQTHFTLRGKVDASDIVALAVSSDYIFASSDYGELFIIDRMACKLLKRVPNVTGGYGLLVFPTDENRLLVTTLEGSISAFSVSDLLTDDVSKAKIFSRKEHSGRVHEVCIIGDILITTSAEYPLLRTWKLNPDLSIAKVSRPLGDQTGWVNCVCVVNSTIYTGSGDFIVRSWKVSESLKENFKYFDASFRTIAETIWFKKEGKWNKYWVLIENNNLFFFKNRGDRLPAFWHSLECTEHPQPNTSRDFAITLNYNQKNLEYAFRNKSAENIFSSELVVSPTWRGLRLELNSNLNPLLDAIKDLPNTLKKLGLTSFDINRLKNLPESALISWLHEKTLSEDLDVIESEEIENLDALLLKDQRFFSKLPISSFQDLLDLYESAYFTKNGNITRHAATLKLILERSERREEFLQSCSLEVLVYPLTATSFQAGIAAAILVLETIEKQSFSIILDLLTTLKLVSRATTIFLPLFKLILEFQDAHFARVLLRICIRTLHYGSLQEQEKMAKEMCKSGVAFFCQSLSTKWNELGPEIGQLKTDVTAHAPNAFQEESTTAFQDFTLIETVQQSRPTFLNQNQDDYSYEYHYAPNMEPIERSADSYDLTKTYRYTDEESIDYEYDQDPVSKVQYAPGPSPKRANESLQNQTDQSLKEEKTTQNSNNNLNEHPKETSESVKSEPSLSEKSPNQIEFSKEEAKQVQDSLNNSGESGTLGSSKIIRISKKKGSSEVDSEKEEIEGWQMPKQLPPITTGTVYTIKTGLLVDSVEKQTMKFDQDSGVFTVWGPKKKTIEFKAIEVKQVVDLPQTTSLFKSSSKFKFQITFTNGKTLTLLVDSRFERRNWMDSLILAKGNIDWDQAFQKIYESAVPVHEKAIKLGLILEHFLETSQVLVRYLVLQNFSDTQIIPSKASLGIAGGEKFFSHGIFFKFCRKDKLYTDEYFASKVASHELRGMNAYLHHEFSSNFPVKLSFPLMAVFDFLGWRVTCQSIIPISNDTLVYGSSDGGKTIHDDSQELSSLMKRVARQLKIKEHLVFNTSGKAYKLAGPADVEGHHVNDRYYIIDTARIFPPTRPLPEFHNSHLYYQFRPEFLAQYPKPLCPDAYIGFARDPKDPLVLKAHNAEIREATEALSPLLKLTLLKFGSYFQRILVLYENLANPNAHWESLKFDPNLLRRFIVDLHRAGINIRFLGKIRAGIKEMRFVLNRLKPEDELIISNLVTTEIVARTFKNLIRKELRLLDSPARGKSVICKYLSAILMRSPELTNDKFLSEHIPKYFPDAILPSESPSATTFDIFKGASDWMVAARLIFFFNIHFSKPLSQCSPPTVNNLLRYCETVAPTHKVSYFFHFQKALQLEEEYQRKWAKGKARNLSQEITDIKKIIDQYLTTCEAKPDFIEGQAHQAYWMSRLLQVHIYQDPDFYCEDPNWILRVPHSTGVEKTSLVALRVQTQFLFEESVKAEPQNHVIGLRYVDFLVRVEGYLKKAESVLINLMKANKDVHVRELIRKKISELPVLDVYELFARLEY